MMTYLLWLLGISCQVIFAKTNNETHETRIRRKAHMTGFIVGGVHVPISMYPHVAQILLKGRPICGGSIISNRIILTSAHCMMQDNKIHPTKILRVLVGSSEALEGTKYDVCKVIPHERYGYKFFYDIALILLTNKIKFGPNVKKVKIVRNYLWKNSKTRLTATGFGYTETEGGKAKNLKISRLRYVDVKTCRKSQSSDEFTGVPRHMFCLVGENWLGDCYGDSGTGIVWKQYIVGIVTRGRHTFCGSEVIPSMYVDILYLRPWIVKNMKKLESTSTKKCVKMTKKTKGEQKMSLRLNKKGDYTITGVDAPTSMYPYMALITRNGKEFCSGVIISDRVILTTAQCIDHEENPSANFYVYLGLQKNNMGTKYEVCDVTPHEKYQFHGRSYDIAAILLKQKIKFNSNIRKAEIASDYSWKNYKHTLTVTDYVVTSNNDISLRVSQMRFLSLDVCNKSMPSLHLKESEHMFCMVSKLWTGECYGKSGSPITWKNFLVGLVTIAVSDLCVSEEMPTLHTDVVSLRTWVYDTVQKLEIRSEENC